MTIGPEPRMRIFSMSLRRGNTLQEAIKQVQAVVGSWAGLGVVLHGPPRHVEQLEPLYGAVVEVDVRQRGLAEVRAPANGLVVCNRAGAVWAHGGEAVVLGGDLHAAGMQVLDRVIGSAMPERQLERLQAHRAAKQLMSQADPPHRRL